MTSHHRRAGAQCGSLDTWRQRQQRRLGRPLRYSDLRAIVRAWRLPTAVERNRIAAPADSRGPVRAAAGVTVASGGAPRCDAGATAPPRST